MNPVKSSAGRARGCLLRRIHNFLVLLARVATLAVTIVAALLGIVRIETIRR